MPISVRCTNCGTKLTAEDKHAGRTVKCPKCEQKLVIEATTSSLGTAPQPTRVAKQVTEGDSISAPVRNKKSEAAEASKPVPLKKAAVKKSQLPTDPEERYQALQTIMMRAFDGDIEPVVSPISYRAGMFLALCVMTILPVIYVALIGLVGYGIYWHAVSNTGIFALAGEARGRNSGKAMVFALMVYVAPIFVGVVGVAFMLKPLFSRPERTRKPRTLSREKEPLLFAYIDRLCDAVHAPRPKQIDVDLQVNASASFRNGIWSMFGSDLTLTLGLPLVAGLPLRNLSGVLAHEFGHFAQGAGMRVTFIVRTIAYWFSRVVYERDHWDAQLEQWSQENDIRIGWLFYLARFMVWLTRRVLWVLMMIGNAVSCLMLRQMEFDADRYEARMAGSETFADTARLLRLISIADQQSWEGLNDGFREGRLIDDMPRFALANFKKLPKSAHQFVDQMTSDSKTGWFDTHPSDIDRNENAAAEDTDGIVQLNRPAMDLFRNFPALSKATTIDLYKEVFGKEFDASTLYSVDETLARQEQETAAHDGLKRFFQSNFTFHRPMSFLGVDLSAPEDRDAAVAELKAARAEFDEAHEAVLKLTQSYRDAAQRLATMAQCRVLIGRGIKIPADFTEDKIRKLADCEVIEAEEHDKQEKLAKRLNRWDSICRRRLLAGLCLLNDSQFDEEIEGIEAMRRHSRELLSVMQMLCQQIDTVKDFANTNNVIGVLFQLLSNDDKNESLWEAVRGQARELIQPVRGMHNALSRTAFPFPTVKERMSVADYAGLGSEPPHHDDLQNQFEASQRLTETVTRLYSRVLGQLCLYAEQIETALGLPELETPEDEK